MSTRTEAENERELFVAGDLNFIPVMELRPLCDGVVQWLTAIAMFKVFRTKSPAFFATETRRLVRIEGEQVPKRIMKYFDSLRPKLERMDYFLNYYATVPAIGPIALALMTMSTRGNGKSHFFVLRAVVKAEGKLNDDGHMGFVSSLANDGSLLTISKTTLPNPRVGVNRKMVPTDDPQKLYSAHRKRIRDAPVVEVAAENLIEVARHQNLLECEDFIKRRVIRPATSGEIAKIRASR